jgi:hypothetical protein
MPIIVRANDERSARSGLIEKYRLDSNQIVSVKNRTEIKTYTPSYFGRSLFGVSPFHSGNRTSKRYIKN